MTSTQVMAPGSLTIERDIDIFPAKLIADPDSAEPTTYGKVRARLTVNNHLMVWQEQNSYPHEAALVIDTIVTNIRSNTIGNNSVVRRMQAITMTTQTGRSLTITPQAGCGCGSRLKMLSNAQLNGQANQPVRPITHTSPTRNTPDAIANNWPNL